MKKSEQLKAELEKLNQERETKIQKMVYYEGHLPENHDRDWNNYWQQFGSKYSEKERELENEIIKEEHREVGISDGVTICLYSDRHAGTVIKKTRTVLTVQHDKAILDPNFKPEFIPGGFSAHCTNQNEQSYTYERDPNGQIETFHWSEKHGRFQGGSDGSIAIINGRHEYYDFNF